MAKLPSTVFKGVDGEGVPGVGVADSSWPLLWIILRILGVASLETLGMVAATTAVVLDRSRALPPGAGVSPTDLAAWGAGAAFVAAGVVTVASSRRLWALLPFLRMGVSAVLASPEVVKVGRQLGPTVASIGMLSYVAAAGVWIALAAWHGVPAAVWGPPAGLAVAAGVLLNAYGTVLRFDTPVLAYEYGTAYAEKPPGWNRLVRWLYMGGSSAGPTRDAHSGRLPWGSTPPELVLLGIPVAAAGLAHGSLGQGPVVHALFASFVTMFLVALVNGRTLVSVDALHWVRAATQEAPVSGHGSSSDTRRTLRGRGAGWWGVPELFEVTSQAVVQRVRDPRLLFQRLTHDLGGYQAHAKWAGAWAFAKYPSPETEVAAAAASASASFLKGHVVLHGGLVRQGVASTLGVEPLAKYLVGQVPRATLEPVDLGAVAELYCCEGLFAVVLHNLLENAAKFTPVDQPGPRVSLTVVEGAIRLEVDDGGPGFATELGFEQACELFRSTTGSSGFGLYHCRRAEERLWSAADLATRRRLTAARVHGRTVVACEFPLYEQPDPPEVQ